jgi:hypothetical protein
VGEYLVELGGLNLQFFNLKDFSLFRIAAVLCKEDQYCAQLRVLSKKILVIFGADKFMIFNVEAMEVTDSIKLGNCAEKIEVRNGFVVVLTSDIDG